MRCIGEPGVERIGSSDRFAETRAPSADAPRASDCPGNVAICSQRLAMIGRHARRCEPPTRIGVMSISATATSHGQPAASSARRTSTIPRVALDQQTIWPRAARAPAIGRLLVGVAAGHDDDDIGAVDRCAPIRSSPARRRRSRPARPRHRYHQTPRIFRKPASSMSCSRNLNPATPARQPIDPADPGADDRNRLTAFRSARSSSLDWCCAKVIRSSGLNAPLTGERPSHYPDRYET